MLTSENYLLGWLYYLGAALGLFLVVWYMSRNWRWRELKFTVRALFAALILVPYPVGDGYDQMAPALLMTALETVFEGAEGMGRAGKPLLTGCIFAIVIALLAEVWLRWRESRRRRRQESVGEEEQNSSSDEPPLDAQPVVAGTALYSEVASYGDAEGDGPAMDAEAIHANSDEVLESAVTGNEEAEANNNEGKADAEEPLRSTTSH